MGKPMSMSEHRAARIARWLGERTRRPPLPYEKVQPGDEQVLPDREQRELDAASVHDPSNAPRHFELNAEPGHYSMRGAPAALSLVTVVYAIGTADGWHLATDHHDLVAYGTELLAVVAFIFVGTRLVARRLCR